VRATTGGASDSFGAAAFVAAGRQLAAVQSGYPSAVIHVWDLATRNEVRRAVLEKAFTGFVFSPDGSTLAGLERDGTVALWDVASGQLKHRPFASFGSTALAFSADGQTLVSVAAPAAVQVWDVSTGAERSRFRCTVPEVLQAALSPDGRWLATRSAVARDRNDNAPRPSACLWDVTKGELVKMIAEKDLSVGSVAFTPDGFSLLATVWGPDGRPRLDQWSLASLRVVR
jgi:WD40 repeat protein